MKDIKRHIILFLIGFFGYCTIEILWRGYTHWTMGILGGLSLNTIFISDMLPVSTAIKSAVCSIAITIMELTAGIILNLWLKLGIWDYSGMFLNFLGQICVFYSAVWFVLSFIILKIIGKLKTFYEIA